MCILRLGENGLEKYRLAKTWEQFKIVLLFMDHPVGKYLQKSNTELLIQPVGIPILFCDVTLVTALTRGSYNMQSK